MGGMEWEIRFNFGPGVELVTADRGRGLDAVRI
jgi:hypothetical protein